MMKKTIPFLAIMLLLACANEKIYQIGQIKTPKGEILLWLYDETPNHKKSFRGQYLNSYL